jgi:hypothetical protein
VDVFEASLLSQQLFLACCHCMECVSLYPLILCLSLNCPLLSNQTLDLDVKRQFVFFSSCLALFVQLSLNNDLVLHKFEITIATCFNN